MTAFIPHSQDDDDHVQFKADNGHVIVTVKTMAGAFLALPVIFVIAPESAMRIARHAQQCASKARKQAVDVRAQTLAGKKQKIEELQAEIKKLEGIE
jgi:hypothetical protein